MKRLTTILCLTLFLTEGSRPLVGREPATHQSSRKIAVSRPVSKKLVWNANPIEDGVSCYNVYEKIDNGRQPPFWKRIGTVDKPSFTLRNLTPGSHAFAVTAVSKLGESPRSSEMVVTSYVKEFSPRDSNAPITKEPGKRQVEGPALSGTGFFVSTDGYLLTNYHVVRNSRRIVVHTEHTDQSAKLVCTDAANDLALLKVDGTVSAIPLGNVRDVGLGDSVSTIGFPNIQVQGMSAKFTAGEISALSGIHDDPRVFQISVPIQPGNGWSAGR